MHINFRKRSTCISFATRAHGRFKNTQFNNIFFKCADKRTCILSKTSRSVSSVIWLVPEISRKSRRKNNNKKHATHVKAKETGSA